MRNESLGTVTHWSSGGASGACPRHPPSAVITASVQSPTLRKTILRIVRSSRTLGVIEIAKDYCDHRRKGFLEGLRAGCCCSVDAESPHGGAHGTPPWRGWVTFTHAPSMASLRITHGRYVARARNASHISLKINDLKDLPGRLNPRLIALHLPRRTVAWLLPGDRVHHRLDVGSRAKRSSMRRGITMILSSSLAPSPMRARSASRR